MKILLKLCILWICLLSYGRVTAQTVEDLVKDLKMEESWESAQQGLEALWKSQGSDTEELLVERAKAAFVAQQGDQAMEHSIDLVTHAPEYAYGWRIYGQIAAAQRQAGAALTGFLHAVILEPNDYVAWASLGMMFEQINYYDEALAAYRKAHAITPFETKAREGISRLERRLKGTEI